MSIMEVKNVGYTYDNRRKVLRSINVQMEQGKLYAILGPSGCGKTTLLSLIGGLDSPTSGQILFEDQDIAKTGLSDHRRNHVSFIFQAYNLYTMYHDLSGARNKYQWNTEGRGFAKASACIRCGKCEQVCPQHLKIRDLLVEVAKTFEGKRQ